VEHLEGNFPLVEFQVELGVEFLVSVHEVDRLSVDGDELAIVGPELNEVLLDVFNPEDVILSSSGVVVGLERLTVTDEVVATVGDQRNLLALGVLVRFKRHFVLVWCSLGWPTVALYSATKAFEKSLGISLAKEMERYGVGVTTLLPGAVKDTDFKSRSNSDKALCWRIPSYPKSPPQVAEMGVRALLRGDQEITPGIWNRIFLKVMKPALPQRLHNFIAEVMWNPIPRLRKRQEAVENTVSITYEIPKADKMNAIAPNRSYNLPNPPTLLQLEVKEPEQNFYSDSTGDTRIEMAPEREIDHFEQTKNSSSAASFSGSGAQPHESLTPGNIDTAPLNSLSLSPAQPPPSPPLQDESQIPPSSSNDFFFYPSTGFPPIESQAPKSPSGSPQASHPRSEARGGNSVSTAQQPSQQGETSDSGVRQRRQISENMDRMALSINGDW